MTRQRKNKVQTKKDNRIYRSCRIPILVSTGIFAVAFAAMLGYLSYFTATSEEEMINNSYNSRQEILASRNYRGTIYSRDGDILAQTMLDEDQNETRVYPYGSLFAHVVGYDSKGRKGVEAIANYYLLKTDIPLTEKVENDVAGKKNPGNQVYTTLDVEMQKVADEQLSLFKGGIIVTEVKTGKILVMTSHPAFDPNTIEEIWDDVVEDENSTILLNRVTQGLYPPGSTFKMITALEFIRENPDSYMDYSFECPGYFSCEGNLIHCYNSSVHGHSNLLRSFAKSCNSSFANIGVGLDKKQFADTLDTLLFNEELPVEFGYAKSSVEVSEDSTVYEMMQTSIGQGKTLITPLHLNMITCAIANDGVLVKPHVIDRIENAHGKVLKSNEPENYGRLMSEEEAAALTELMTEVVLSGTAYRKLGKMEYTAAGKTGSAEYNDEGECHAWFTAFSPVDDPQIAVTVVVEGAGEGGDFAVPIARRLFDCYYAQQEENDD